MGAATEGCPHPQGAGPFSWKRASFGQLGLGWMDAPGGGVLPTRSVPSPGLQEQGPLQGLAARSSRGGPAPPMVPSRSRGWEDWLGPRTSHTKPASNLVTMEK